MSATRTWHMTLWARSEWGARHRDGRPARQVHAVVSARSKKAAAEVFGVSLYEFNNYAGEGSEPAVLVGRPLLTMAVRPLDVGGTIRGEIGWQLAGPEVAS